MKRSLSFALALTAISSSGASAQSAAPPATCNPVHVSAIKQQLKKLEGAPLIDDSLTCAVLADKEAALQGITEYSFERSSQSSFTGILTNFELKENVLVLLEVIYVDALAGIPGSAPSSKLVACLNEEYLASGQGSSTGGYRKITGTDFMVFMLEVESEAGKAFAKRKVKK